MKHKPAKACPVCVRVLRHGDTEPQWASKLVWWLAGLTSEKRVFLEPMIGDIVVETTHRLGMAKSGLGLIDAVGELIKIEENDQDGKIYTIKTLEGKEQRWLNAMMAVVERPRQKISNEPDNRTIHSPIGGFTVKVRGN